MLLANRQVGRYFTLCSFATLVKCCLVKSLKALRRCSNNHMRWWCVNTRISEIMSCQESAIFLANCMQFAKNGPYHTKSLKFIYSPTSRCRGYRFFLDSLQLIFSLTLVISLIIEIKFENLEMKYMILV